MFPMMLFLLLSTEAASASPQSCQVWNRHIYLCPQGQFQTDDWLGSFHMDGFFHKSNFFPKWVPDSPSSLLWPGCNLSTRYLWIRPKQDLLPHSPASARLSSSCLDPGRVPELPASHPSHRSQLPTWCFPDTQSACFPFLLQTITLTSLFIWSLYKKKKKRKKIKEMKSWIQRLLYYFTLKKQ